MSITFGKLATGAFALFGAAVSGLLAYDYVAAQGAVRANTPLVSSLGAEAVASIQPRAQATGPLPSNTAPARVVADTPTATAIRARVSTTGAWTPAHWTGASALPSGARFQLVLNPTHAGRVEIYAVNAAGEGSKQPLWTGWVPANSEFHTPVMRLEGMRGVETLNVALLAVRDHRGHLIRSGSATKLTVVHY